MQVYLVLLEGRSGADPLFLQVKQVYADQNERDHAQLVSAIAAGAVESQPG